MTELVPNKFAVVSGRIIQRRLRRAQIAADDTIPITQPRVDVRRHVDRMRVVRRDPFVLARDFK